MADNLQRVVAEVVSAGPDHVLVNGDLALATGERADYATLQELLLPLTSRGIPLYVTPGNHDDRANLVAAFSPASDPAVPDKVVSSALIGGVHWIFLDSLEQFSPICGSLGAVQRDWLARKLDSTAAPAIVCVHHNPERSLVGLQDTDKLLGIILPRRRVKAVIFGHTHEFRLWQDDGLHFVNLPACGYCLLLKPNVPLGWVWARVGQSGMRLEFCGVTLRDRGHGTTHDLPWRSDL
jgi:3',5'-cyclic AMP phosphodiesterase CpdA